MMVLLFSKEGKILANPTECHSHVYESETLDISSQRNGFLSHPKIWLNPKDLHLVKPL